MEFNDEAKEIFNASMETERAHAVETNMKRKRSSFSNKLKDVCDGRFTWKSNEVPLGISYCSFREITSITGWEVRMPFILST